MSKVKGLFKHFKDDLPSGVVVFFVALPLCLAIAQASTGSSEFLFAGILAGIIGGCIIGFLSGTEVGVSGPAAGLVVIVSEGITNLTVNGDIMSGYRSFLFAVCVAGLLQFLAGYLKAGIIGKYFPSSVIKGMLAAIGITIILKEIPHALGYDKDFMGDEAFIQKDGHNTLSELYYAFKYNSPGAIIISGVSLFLLILTEQPALKKLAVLKYLPSALIAVLASVIVNQLLPAEMRLQGEHLVSLPVAGSLSDLGGFITTPDLNAWSNPKVYQLGVVLFIVASIESLLSMEAGDKLDPQKRISNPDKELKAQGIGNFVSGLIGGLPVTQVIVRTSANINSGAKTRLSSITHGFLLLISVIFFPGFLNLIPLAGLAGLLIMIGYKLCNVTMFKNTFKLGWDQFVPFMVTIIAIMLSDLLKGIAIGILVALFYIIRAVYRNTIHSISETKLEGSFHKIKLAEQVSFINKGAIVKAFEMVPDNSHLLIDASSTTYIDHDVLESINEFYVYGSKERNIKVDLLNIPKLQTETTN